MKMTGGREKTIIACKAFNAAKVVSVSLYHLKRFEGLDPLMYDDTLPLNDVRITILTKLLLIIINAIIKKLL